MIKELSFILIITVLIALAGCGKTQPNNPINEVNALLGAFESAVEQYKVTDMLACLSGNDFTLTLEEAGQSDTKTYVTLEDELQSDETNQVNWRKSAADGGHNYVLDLVLSDPILTNTSDNGTCATQTFEVWESAEGIDRIKTDNGSITWQIAQSSGEWKATSMIITYQALNATGLSKYSIGGFGFTKLPVRFIF